MPIKFFWWVFVAVPLLGWANDSFIVTNQPTLPDRSIFIDPSSTAVAGFGKATLTIGALRREGKNFCGTYHVRVTPYSYKNENGRLVIVVSDQAVREIVGGYPIAVTGTATTTDTGKTRFINATALPSNGTNGVLKISFVTGKKKITFEPVYRLID